jgi:hypothetical protein
MLFTVSSFCGFERKPYSTLDEMILTKEIAKQENLTLFVENNKIFHPLLPKPFP